MRGMRVLIGTAVLTVGALLPGVPSVSHALNISSIVVTNGGATFSGCNTAAVCTNKIWDLGPGGVNLNPGDTLVLTQNQAHGGGVAGFNFDTSDFGSAAFSISVNGGAPIADSGGILNFHGVDNPNSTTQNEAANWSGPIGGVPGSYQVQVGYADNLHTDPCADGAPSNCLPEGPWQGTATVFLGNGSTAPDGYPVSAFPNHCVSANGDCFDAGAILITAVLVPGPSTLLLFGGGLMGLAAYGRRRLKQI